MSYDPVQVVAEFADVRGITFPMLSDVGSRVIDALGLRNSLTREQARQYGMSHKSEFEGVPHPGTFVLDEDGVVVDRWFEQSYRLRSSGAVLLERLTGAAEPERAGVAASTVGNGVAVRGWVPDRLYRPWIETVLHLDITMDAGLHVYGRPVPDGYQALDVAVAARPALWVGEPVMPEPEPFRIDGLDEEFYVYSDTFRVDVALTVTENRGPIDLQVQIDLQTCDDAACLIPETLQLGITLEGADHDLPVPPLPSDG